MVVFNLHKGCAVILKAADHLNYLKSTMSHHLVYVAKMRIYYLTTDKKAVSFSASNSLFNYAFITSEEVLQYVNILLHFLLEPVP